MLEIMTIKSLLETAIRKQATDLHLVVGQPPVFRIHGELHYSEQPPLQSAELTSLLLGILTDKQKEKFFQAKEIDFSYLCVDGYQFRVNIHLEKGNIASTIRITALKIKSAEELLLPPIIEDLAKKRKGFIILAGAAGSGKSTTLNYLVNRINHSRKCKIIMIEDPIEFVHVSNQSLIVQREVGSDTDSFATALKYSLRQNPDVVVVGEIRDPESISMALTAVETGHLVITTLHAPDAVESLTRIIDVCPALKQEQIRMQLAENLTAIIYQVLVPKKDVPGLVLATEVLQATLPVRNLIRRNAFTEIRGQMDNDPSMSGMHTLEFRLSLLVKEGRISVGTAREYAKYSNYLKLDESPQ